MDFTPAGSEGSDILDDLKKDVINDNLQPGEESQAPIDVESSLNILDDDLSQQTETFSMSALEGGLDDSPTVQAEDFSTDISQKISSDDAQSSTLSDTSEVPVVPPLSSATTLASEKTGTSLLDDISIEEEIPPTSPSFSFDDDETEVKKKSFSDTLKGILNIRIQGHSLTLFVLGGFMFFAALIASAYFYYAERYVYYSTRPEGSLDETSQGILDKIESYRDTIQAFGIFPIDDDQHTYFNVNADQDMVDLRQLLSDDSVSYVSKYNAFGQYVRLLDKRLPVLYADLTQSREELASYPFFPDTLQELIDPENDASLQRSLLSLEAVKFRTAIAVFSKFDTFVRQFALDTGKEKESVQSFIDEMMERGDRDIDYYLSTCYLNPYERPDACTQYGDFARMYDIYESDTEGIDTELFAELMGFIEDKLEKSVLPSLALSTRDFDPIAQQLTLVIDVNTLPDDTLQLLKQGILNPHVYVVGHMINFLRQSKFIISEDINVNSLEIDKLTVPIGSKEVTVSTSHFEFTLPLQKNTQREITDYFERTQPTAIIDLDDHDDNFLSGSILSGSILSGSILDISSSGSLLSGGTIDEATITEDDVDLGVDVFGDDLSPTSSDNEIEPEEEEVSDNSSPTVSSDTGQTQAMPSADDDISESLDQFMQETE